MQEHTNFTPGTWYSMRYFGGDALSHVYSGTKTDILRWADCPRKHCSSCWHSKNNSCRNSDPQDERIVINLRSKIRMLWRMQKAKQSSETRCTDTLEHGEKAKNGFFSNTISLFIECCIQCFEAFSDILFSFRTTQLCSKVPIGLVHSNRYSFRWHLVFFLVKGPNRNSCWSSNSIRTKKYS